MKVLKLILGCIAAFNVLCIFAGVVLVGIDIIHIFGNFYTGLADFFRTVAKDMMVIINPGLLLYCVCYLLDEFDDTDEN